MIPEKNQQTPSTFFLLVAETGEVLASHFCSHSFYAFGDLYRDRPERIEEWTKRFGDFEVKYIDEVEDLTEEELIKRNHANFKQSEAKNDKS